MTHASHSTAETRIGVFCGISAYLLWGLAPLYFKALAGVPAGEVIAHRILWTTVLMAGVLILLRNASGVRQVRRTPGVLWKVGLAAVLVTGNWLVFVWAIQQGRVLETSLGYYVNPLVSMLLAFLLLGERLRRVQLLAVSLAGLGVANQVLAVGHLPWVSLVLAFSFAGYGVMRKRIALDAFNGLFFETLLLAPLAMAYLFWQAQSGALAFGRNGPGVDALLLGAGVVTAVPLVLFAAGAKRLRLSTLGFLQYLAPTLTFLQAVFLFGEPFSQAHLVTFGLIWAGLLVYSLDAWRNAQRAANAA